MPSPTSTPCGAIAISSTSTRWVRSTATQPHRRDTSSTAPRCVPYATACRWSACPPREPDQAPITQLLEQWKVSRALPGDADVAQIRAAADEVLSNPICREEAKQRSLAFVGLDGAELAADSVEALIAGA